MSAFSFFHEQSCLIHSTHPPPPPHFPNLLPPLSCPFTIHVLGHSTYLIRESDSFTEYPHIYAKIVSHPTITEPLLIILSDTGVGTNTPNSNFPIDSQPQEWNIRTFLEYTLNPGGRIPYLVISSHCHFDHILGLAHLPATGKGNLFTPTGLLDQDLRLPVDGLHGDRLVYLCPVDSRGFNSYAEFRPRCSKELSASVSPATTVLASRKGIGFVTPYSNLQTHSLCDDLGLRAPKYKVHLWANDLDEIVVQLAPAADMPLIQLNEASSISTDLNRPIIRTGVVLFQTPGHTPDSLAFYDAPAQTIYVGDSLYERTSLYTSHASEPPMPVIFTNESNLTHWWDSLNKVITFVKDRDCDIIRRYAEDFRDRREYDFASLDDEENTHPPRPMLTRLSAAHVTVAVPALDALRRMRRVMALVLQDALFSKSMGVSRGEEVRLWDATLNGEEARFSVQAPLRVVEEGRRDIPRDEWRPVEIKATATMGL